MIELYTMKDPEHLQAVSLPDLRVGTLGRRFFGLSAVVFRRMLRYYGVKVESRVKRSQDLIIVGERPSLSGEINAMKICDGKKGPVFADHLAFLARFLCVLRNFEVRKGLTLQKYLEMNKSISPTNLI